MSTHNCPVHGIVIAMAGPGCPLCISIGEAAERAGVSPAVALTAEKLPGPRGDLQRLAELLATTAGELEQLAHSLSDHNAEVYCAQLEKASHSFGEALELSESLIQVWERPPGAAS